MIVTLAIIMYTKCMLLYFIPFKVNEKEQNMSEECLPVPSDVSANTESIDVANIQVNKINIVMCDCE